MATIDINYPDWDGDVTFGVYERYATYYYVSVAFEFLTLGATVVFLVWSLFIRQPGTDSSEPLPLKALVGSILSFTIKRFLDVLIDIFTLAEATVKQSFVVIYILNTIFISIAFVLSLFVFWSLVHRLLDRISGKGPNKNRVVVIVHWVFLALFAAVIIARCGVYIAVVVGDYSSDFNDIYVEKNNYRMMASLSIIYCAASLEVLAWMVFIFVKAGIEKRTGVPAIAGAAFFFFGDNVMGMITHILYNIESKSSPRHLNATINIVEFVCIVATYVFLLLGLQQWSRSGVSNGSHDTMDNYNNRTVSNESMIISAPSIRSQHATFHSQPGGKGQVRIAVPEGAPPGQQVHMWS